MEILTQHIYPASTYMWRLRTVPFTTYVQLHRSFVLRFLLVLESVLLESYIFNSFVLIDYVLALQCLYTDNYDLCRIGQLI